VLGELGRKLVEVLGQLNLTSQQAERLGNRTPTRESYEPDNGPAGPLNDDVLAAFSEVDEP
jgi:hypothetical protein